MPNSADEIAARIAATANGADLWTLVKVAVCHRKGLGVSPAIRERSINRWHVYAMTVGLSIAHQALDGLQRALDVAEAEAGLLSGAGVQR